MMIFTTFWLLVLSIMDVCRRRVPVWLLTVGGVGIVFALIGQCGSDVMDHIEVLKGTAPGVFLLGTGLVTKRVGYGDGIVLLVLGMVLGLERSMLLLGLSLFFISVCALLLLAFRKVRRNTKLPYIPFLTAAWLLMLCY